MPTLRKLMDLLRLDAVGIVAKVRTVHRRSRVTLELMIGMKGVERWCVERKSYRREGEERERE